MVGTLTGDHVCVGEDFAGECPFPYLRSNSTQQCDVTFAAHIGETYLAHSVALIVLAALACLLSLYRLWAEYKAAKDSVAVVHAQGGLSGEGSPLQQAWRPVSTKIRLFIVGGAALQGLSAIDPLGFRDIIKPFVSEQFLQASVDCTFGALCLLLYNWVASLQPLLGHKRRYKGVVHGCGYVPPPGKHPRAEPRLYWSMWGIVGFDFATEAVFWILYMTGCVDSTSSGGISAGLSGVRLLFRAANMCAWIAVFVHFGMQAIQKVAGSTHSAEGVRVACCVPQKFSKSAAASAAFRSLVLLAVAAGVAAACNLALAVWVLSERCAIFVLTLPDSAAAMSRLMVPDYAQLIAYLSIAAVVESEQTSTAAVEPGVYHVVASRPDSRRVVHRRHGGSAYLERSPRGGDVRPHGARDDSGGARARGQPGIDPGGPYKVKQPPGMPEPALTKKIESLTATATIAALAPPGHPTMAPVPPVLPRPLTRESVTRRRQSQSTGHMVASTSSVVLGGPSTSGIEDEADA